jgi:beta-galactosidase
MKNLSRRDLLKTSLLAPAVAAVAREGVAKGKSPNAGRGELSSPSAAQPGAEPDSAAPGAGRERLLLDFGWRFHFGNADDQAKDFGFGYDETGNFQKTGNFIGASALAFDDSDWKALDLPHDWAVELPFQEDPALTSKGSYPLGRGYPATSVGWYRRVFDLPASDAGKRIFIEFDGAYRNTMVVLNGFYIGQHAGGYDPFSFDVTDFATPGSPNVLLARVDATLSDGWFYEGAGIYRHLWLVKTHPVHVKKWGTFARSVVRRQDATVLIRTEVNNHGKGSQSARITSTVYGPSGQAVGKAATTPQSIREWQTHTWEQEVRVSRPALWSLEKRNLYKLVTEVEAGGQVVDRYETRFGIRTIHFDAQKGFFLNGEPVKLKGTCNHQDHAGLGVALPDAVQHYRIRKLREMGSNALRTSHNPPTPELLDACDELGMLVFDETRMMSSNPEGLAQFRDLVRRDRNRPSVFMWSMGNEEGVANTKRGVSILTAMKKVASIEDGSRPVSCAPTGAIGRGGLTVCDVKGYNYMDPQAAAYHKTHPNDPVMGTETVSAVGTRGIYITDAALGYVGSYDPYTTTGRASAEGWWKFCNAQPWLAGGFVWTGFDYRGEPSPYGWPNISSQYGIIDTCGFPKDTYYYYKSWWASEPVLHVFPHWNWAGREGEEIAVWVHSNLDKVELFLNGESLGAQQMQKDSHLSWIVKYAPGTIEAHGYKGTQHVLTAKRETTGPAARLVMTADREEILANGEDVAMFAVEVQDAEGRVVPVTDHQVTFQVSGPGKLIGVGNGDPTCHESDKGASRKAFSGRCMAIVQSVKMPGSITVDASSTGLAGASVTTAARSVMLRPQVAVWERKAPVGEGITGLWRPVQTPEQENSRFASFLFGRSILFTFIQEGTTLTGSVEAGGFFGRGQPASIEAGTVDGDKISFKMGYVTYSGTLTADRIELLPSFHFPFHFGRAPKAPSGQRPAIGPPPNGTDPSIGSRFRRPPSAIVLQRVTG